MILAEPPRTDYDLHFTLLGFPVRIHWMFWLSAVLLSGLGDFLGVVIWIVAMLLCILLHELGHAVVMRAYGFRPSIVLYSFGGLAIPHPGPTGLRRPGPWGDILIAFAGPASGFILAVVLLVGLHYLGGFPIVPGITEVSIADLRAGGNLIIIFSPTWRDVAPVWYQLGQHHGNLAIVPHFVNCIFEITVYWGLLNILPIYPLDGGQIALQFFVLANPRDAVRQSLILSVVVGGLMGVMALVYWQNWFLAILFFWLTYSNFMALQSQGGWR